MSSRDHLLLRERQVERKRVGVGSSWAKIGCMASIFLGIVIVFAVLIILGGNVGDSSSPPSLPPPSSHVP